MTDGKWITDLRPDMPVHRAAEVILADRLDAVGRTWMVALTGDATPEHLHALRVTTRRAAAALRTIGYTLSSRREAKLGKLLRKLRRAAGTARDADVLVERLVGCLAQRPADEHPGLDLLLGSTLERRGLAVVELRSTIRWRPKWESVRRVVRPRRRGHETLADRAAATMPAMVTAFDEAASADLQLPQNLHRLRVRGKRFRYALELFVDCYPPVVRERLYPAIEEVQDCLGDAHDAHIHAAVVTRTALALATLEEAARVRASQGISALAARLRASVAAGPGRFAAWYQPWRDLAASVDFGKPVTIV